MAHVVFVEDMDGKPLMPTKRFGKVRRMLKDKKAKVVCIKPFKIRLLYEPKTKICQDIELGIDPGRTNIGYAAVQIDTSSKNCGECLMDGTLETRNKEIPKLMAERADHRRASRSGERQRRKRRAKKCGTTTEFPEGRKLPGYEDPLMLKDIINTESRFNNRKRPPGWVTPTVRQLIQTHLNLIRLIGRFLPISHVSIELNRFAFMELEAGKRLYGDAFCKGPLFGSRDSDEVIYAVQEGKCLLCDHEIEHIHHIVPVSHRGSDTLKNKAGLCACCHRKVHTNPQAAEELQEKKAGSMKKYAGTSVLNQAMPFIVKELKEEFGENLHITVGYETKEFRDTNKIEKTHSSDATCIACSRTGVVPSLPGVEYDLKQFRRHDRSIINNQRERTYKLDGKTVAKNRKTRFEQKGPSLQDWFLEEAREVGMKTAMKLRSELTVTKSTRRYNNPGRRLPGAVFLYEGKRYVMTGQLSNGKYLRALGEGKRNFPIGKCAFIGQGGLVFV